MAKKTKATPATEAAAKPAKQGPVRRWVAPDRVAEREGQGFKRVASEPLRRNGSVLMEKA